MANDLTSFLQKTAVDEMEQEVSIPGRLAKFKFKVKPINSKQFSSYQQIATISSSKTKEVKFNTAKFNELVIINHVVEPNFRDAALLSSAGVSTPEQYLNKFLLAGEVSNLSDKISEISGFVTPDTELEDEVKNS